MVGRKNTLKKVKFDCQFKVGGNSIEWVDHFCYLGVFIDKCLTFNLTIEQMHRKAAYRLKNFIALRGNLTLHSAMIFAKSLILPYIDYCLFLLSSCHASHLKKLQTLQNRVLKVALGVNHFYSTHKLHSQCNVLLVADRIKWQQLKLIHRSITLGIDIYPCKTTSTTTRLSSTVQLNTQTPHTELFRKSICYHGIREYTLLASDLKSASLRSFGPLLKKLLVDNYIAHV